MGAAVQQATKGVAVRPKGQVGCAVAVRPAQKDSGCYLVASFSSPADGSPSAVR